MSRALKSAARLTFGQALWAVDWTLVDESRLVAVLKKVSVSLIATIEIHGIAGEDATHGFSERLLAGSYGQMKVVRHQAPGIYASVVTLACLFEPPQKILTVTIRQKYLSY